MNMNMMIQCFDWKFIQFENGYALNCYPDAVIWDLPGIIGYQLKFLTLVEIKYLKLQNV